jgi:hypothetical protein
MNMNPVLNNPYLGYKLDPGEPGLLTKAKASESTLRVTAQEQRNLDRLVTEAVQEGRVVVWAGITYQPTIGGSFMGTAAGHTTVISVEKPENKTALSSNYPEKETKNPSGTGAEDQTPTEQNGSSAASIDPQLAQKSSDELTKQEATLQAKIAELKSQMEEVDNASLRDENNVTVDQAAQKKQHLSREVQEKEKELNKIAIAKLIKMQSDLTATMNQGFIQNSVAPLAMIKAAYGAGLQPPSQGGFEKIV